MSINSDLIEQIFSIKNFLALPFSESKEKDYFYAWLQYGGGEVYYKTLNRLESEIKVILEKDDITKLYKEFFSGSFTDSDTDTDIDIEQDNDDEFNFAGTLLSQQGKHTQFKENLTTLFEISNSLQHFFQENIATLIKIKTAWANNYINIQSITPVSPLEFQRKKQNLFFAAFSKEEISFYQKLPQPAPQ